MPVLALSGKKRTGKDVFAKVLIDKHGYKRISLADPLRDLCSKMFKLSIETFSSDDLKDKPFDKPIALDFHHIDVLREVLITEYGYEVNSEMREELEGFEGTQFETPRDMLRVVGTKMCRIYVDDNIWLRRAVETMKESGGKVVITDCRFENERELMRKVGAILIRIKRNDDGNSKEHEFDLGKDHDYDVIFDNNGTLQEYISNINLWYTIRKEELEYQYSTKLEGVL